MLNPFIKVPKFMKRFEDMWCSMCDLRCLLRRVIRVIMGSIGIKFV